MYGVEDYTCQFYRLCPYLVGRLLHLFIPWVMSCFHVLYQFLYVVEDYLASFVPRVFTVESWGVKHWGPC